MKVVCFCDVINKTGVVYQVSVEDRFLPTYHEMAEIALNGRLGALKHIEISLPVTPLPKKNLEVTAPPQDLDFDLWLGRLRKFRLSIPALFTISDGTTPFQVVW